MKNATLIIIFLASAAFSLHAQQLERSVIASAGAYGSSGNIKMDYTIGDLVVATGTTPSLILTQGFEQADYISTSVDPSLTDLLTDIHVFPNPASGEVTLSGTFAGATRAELQIWDAAGKLVGSKTLSIQSGQLNEKVDLSGLSAGQYHFSLYDGEILRGSFKVRKLH